MRELTYGRRWERGRAWHVPGVGHGLADVDGRRPCAVMVCGGPSMRTYVASFAAAGCDVLVVEVRASRAARDLRAAVAEARLLGSVRPDQLVLWGSGAAAEHVLAAAELPGVAAAIVVRPARPTVRRRTSLACPVLVQVDDAGTALFRDPGWPADADVRRYDVAADDPLGVAALAVMVREQVGFVADRLTPTRMLAAV